MLDTKTLEGDCKNCRIFGWILAVVATLILIWILGAMGLPTWLLVILGLVIAVALVYYCNNYCQQRMEAAARVAADAAAKQAATKRADAVRAAAEERVARQAAEMAEIERLRAEAERIAAGERTARETAKIAEVERQCGEADAREAAEQAAAERRAAQAAADAADAERLRAEAEAREAAERAASEQHTAQAAADAAKAERLRAEAEARKAAERTAAVQFAVATMPPDPAPDSATADDLRSIGDGILDPSAEGARPAALTGPRNGTADDLKKIKGVGPKLERQCNELGFYHFDQIAAWSDREVAWVDANLLGFKGRVAREKWVEQATILAADGETEFSRRFDQS